MERKCGRWSPALKSVSERSEMIRVREVIEAQEELIAAQNVLIEWLLSQVHAERKKNVGHDCKVRNGEMCVVPYGRRGRASRV